MFLCLRLQALVRLLELVDGFEAPALLFPQHLGVLGLHASQLFAVPALQITQCLVAEFARARQLRARVGEALCQAADLFGEACRLGLARAQRLLGRSPARLRFVTPAALCLDVGL